MWDADTGKQLRVFEGHTERILAAVMSQDGQRVLSGTGHKTVRLWYAKTGERTLTALVGSAQMAARQAQAVVVGMVFLLFMIAEALASGVWVLERRAVSQLTGAGALCSRP